MIAPTLRSLQSRQVFVPLMFGRTESEALDPNAHLASLSALASKLVPWPGDRGNVKEVSKHGEASVTTTGVESRHLTKNSSSYSTGSTRLFIFHWHQHLRAVLSAVASSSLLIWASSLRSRSCRAARLSC